MICGDTLVFVFQSAITSDPSETHFTFSFFFLQTFISSRSLHNCIEIPQQLFSKNRGGQRTHHSAIMSLQEPICLGEIRSSRFSPRETRSVHLPCPADSPRQETTPRRSGSPADGSDRFNVSMLAQRRASGLPGSNSSSLSCITCDAELVAEQTRQLGSFLLL